jgi:hypothetical protein
MLKLAFVQMPTPVQRATAEAAARRGEAVPFVDDLDAIRAELLARGVEVVATDPTDDLPPLRGLRPEDIFAFGGLPTMRCWLQRFGWEMRIARSYPSTLDGWLNRGVWRGTPADLLAGPARTIQPIFVKTCRPCFPEGERFEGQLWPTLDRLAHLHPSLAGETFLCSETVRFLSEYRCYVMRGRLLGIYAYQLFGVFCGPVDAGALEQHDPTLRPSPELVQEATQRLEEAGAAPDAYALDLGRIALGPMSLVELNDAVAVRNYGLSAGDYLDFHLARWRQLARS